ncbi:MAG: c-type cytochrome [Lewinellaceae bacterium]|nr:c-type cytochrome [Lewinellaceae bacterium]
MKIRTEKPFMGSGRVVLLAIAAGVLLLARCTKDDPAPGSGCDLTGIPYNPTPYTILKPDHFPQVPVPAGNPQTAEGVQLGRRLFYDPILSGDSTMSCSSCHLPQGSFTDNKAVSKGIDGIEGRRSAMSLLNIAYATNGLFWDGRAAALEDQALLPVEDPIEMHATWTQVVGRLQDHSEYPELFRKAFGISSCSQITKELAARALAQFERILISSGTSKFDLFTNGDAEFEDEELRGKLMFFDEGQNASPALPDAQCFHCHGGITLTGNNYFNNGLDSVGALNEFVDIGRGDVTKNPSDYGKFRAPTLRNIALTAPYMHDGRFATLEEVMAQYNDNGFGVSNEDIFVQQIGFPVTVGSTVHYSGLTAQQTKDVIAFLHTLTDTTFVNNPDIQDPFQ